MLHRLTAREVASLDRPGRHADGGGLYLNIDKAGRKRWVFLVMRAGRRRELGLGPVGAVSLKQARETAARMRAAVQSGDEPARARAGSGDVSVPTFGKSVEQFLAAHEAGWRNDRKVTFTER